MKPIKAAPRSPEDEYKALIEVMRQQDRVAQRGTGGTPFATPAIPTTMGIDWSKAQNQYASAAVGEELHEPWFFGVPMAYSHIGGNGKKVNALWALGFRLHLAGLYNGMQQRIYSAVPIGEDVHIFLQTKQGKPVIVTDSKVNFPSDELITKLRMLEG